MKKFVYLSILTIAMTLSLGLYFATDITARLDPSSNYATHIDVPEGEEVPNVEGTTVDTTIDFKSTIVIKDFLDKNRAVWLVEEQETGKTFVLKADENHGYGIGNKTFVEGKNLNEKLNGHPVVQIVSAEGHSTAEFKGLITETLVEEIIVLENQLPKNLKFIVKGKDLNEDVLVAILLKASTEDEEPVDVWSENTYSVWDQSQNGIVFDMEFNTDNIPVIANDPNAQFTIKAWPFEDFEGKYMIEKVIK
jgi:hypothetical protein